MDKISDKLECQVCKKMFNKEQYVALKASEEHCIMQVEDMICSDKCKKRYDLTWANKKDFCGECGEKVKESEINGYYDIYDFGLVLPVCKKCNDIK